MPDLPTLRDPATKWDRLAGLAIAGLFWLVLLLAVGVIVYYALVGVADCADPWAGCETVMGVVE